MDLAQSNFHFPIYPFAGSITSLIKVIQIGCRHILADMHVSLFVTQYWGPKLKSGRKVGLPFELRDW
jgi:hypothetical protein